NHLIFLNPDTEVMPGWATALIAALEANPQVGLVTSKVLLMQTPEQINTCGNAVHITGLTLCRGMGMPRQHYAGHETVNAISGAAFAMRRELFEALGGFDEIFFLYMEDTDLSLRARMASYQCLYVPDSVVYHDYQLTFGPQKTFYQERNRYLMLLKALKWPTLLVLLPALLLAEGITWGFALLNDRAHLGNKLRAYAWIIEHWQSIMECRRQVQALRRVRDRDLLREHAYKLDFEQVHSGMLAHLAGAFFNPLFWALHRLILTLVWW
ncbi:MAG: glycosyltransferase family 2 protein, partial [Anaerolineae bacterium]|nr:glycosyltransferase family 2 protein [Anaerolineae bacterium]